VFTNGLGTIAANSRANKAVDAQGKVLANQGRVLENEGKVLDNQLKTKRLNAPSKPEKPKLPVQVTGNMRASLYALGMSSTVVTHAPNEAVRNAVDFKNKGWIDGDGVITKPEAIKRRVDILNARYARKYAAASSAKSDPQAEELLKELKRRYPNASGEQARKVLMKQFGHDFPQTRKAMGF
jgi:hypothetical protein